MRYWTLTIVLLCAFTSLQAQLPGVFEAYTSTGVQEGINGPALKGNPSGGDLVQILWVGPNGDIDPPDVDGIPTGDDSLLGTTHIGNGFPSPSDHDRGLFVATFTHLLFANSTIVYMRAWNDPVAKQGVDYGDSETYIVQSSYDTHDFGTWYIGDEKHIAVELVSFRALANAGNVLLTWSTHSETENSGFHVFRSHSRSGVREQLTEGLIPGAGSSSAKHNYSWKDDNVEDEETYYYWVADVAMDGKTTFYGPREVTVLMTPDTYMLDQNFPNPFNPSTVISFALKEAGDVTLSVFNIKGQLIRELANGEHSTGKYSVEWDGRDMNGHMVPTGIYLYALQINDFNVTRKMIFTK